MRDRNDIPCSTVQPHDRTRRTAGDHGIDQDDVVRGAEQFNQSARVAAMLLNPHIG